MHLMGEHNATTKTELRARNWRAALRELIALAIKRGLLERDRATSKRHLGDALYLLGLWDD